MIDLTLDDKKLVIRIKLQDVHRSNMVLRLIQNIYPQHAYKIDVEDLREKLFRSKRGEVCIVITQDTIEVLDISETKMNGSKVVKLMDFMKACIESGIDMNDVVGLSIKNDLLRDGMVVETEKGEIGLVCHILNKKAILFKEIIVPIEYNYDDNMKSKAEGLYDIVKIYYSNRVNGYDGIGENVVEEKMIWEKA